MTLISRKSDETFSEVLPQLEPVSNFIWIWSISTRGIFITRGNLKANFFFARVLDQNVWIWLWPYAAWDSFMPNFKWNLWFKVVAKCTFRFLHYSSCLAPSLNLAPPFPWGSSVQACKELGVHVKYNYKDIMFEVLFVHISRILRCWYKRKKNSHQTWGVGGLKSCQHSGVRGE